MTLEDRATWEDFKAIVTNKLTPEYRNILCTFHAQYYNHKYNEPCTCNGKIYRMWIADIDRVYDKKNS